MKEKRVQEIAAIMFAWQARSLSWREAMERVNGDDREERCLARCIDRDSTRENVVQCIRLFVVKDGTL